MQYLGQTETLIACLGIDSYTFQYKKQSEDEWKNAQTTTIRKGDKEGESEFRYVNLYPGTSYQFRVNITDKAGNIKYGNVINKSTQTENQAPNIQRPSSSSSAVDTTTTFDPETNKITITTTATDNNNDALVYRLFLSKLRTGPTISREATDQEKKDYGLQYIYVTEYSKEANAGEKVSFIIDKFGEKDSETALEEAAQYYYRIIVSDKQTSFVSNPYTCHTSCDGIEGHCYGPEGVTKAADGTFMSAVVCENCNGTGYTEHQHSYDNIGTDPAMGTLLKCWKCGDINPEENQKCIYTNDGRLIVHEHTFEQKDGHKICTTCGDIDPTSESKKEECKYSKLDKNVYPNKIVTCGSGGTGRLLMSVQCVHGSTKEHDLNWCNGSCITDSKGNIIREFNYDGTFAVRDYCYNCKGTGKVPYNHDMSGIKTIMVPFPRRWL